jgi:hypothetical protein
MATIDAALRSTARRVPERQGAVGSAIPAAARRCLSSCQPPNDGQRTGLHGGSDRHPWPRRHIRLGAAPLDRGDCGLHPTVVSTINLAGTHGRRGGSGDQHPRWPIVCGHRRAPCLPSSIRAMTFLCTSSGPSASRTARAVVQAPDSGKSLDKPAPPWICIAKSMTRWAMFGAATLMALTSLSAPSGPTVSSFHAASRMSSHVASIAIRASATRSRLPPRLMIGLPKALRDKPRSHAKCNARSAKPTIRIA